MKNGKTIFSFWEPKGNMTPYLRLCIKTWEKNLPDYKVIILDYSNIDQYLPEGTFDMSVLKGLPLMMQKDAIMVGVLKEHGGVFLDADTLVTGDIAPMFELLKDTEAVMFDYHCAFVLSRPGARLLKLWQEIIQERLKRVGQNGNEDLPWDYLSNGAMAEAMDAMIMKKGGFYATQKTIEDKIIEAYRKITRNETLLTPDLIMWINRIGNALAGKQRAFYFRAALKQYLAMLNRMDHGFIPEAVYFPSRIMHARDKYNRFWFDDEIDTTNAFTPNQKIIGLHHSWTPQWYKDLSEKDVLENKCLLSRTIKHLL
ncbi:MAG: capsular polysaccharide synthesis protein [Smithella sp.]|nr:capsular polysaccharide synthesis protein [Smithella sp.]